VRRTRFLLAVALGALLVLAARGSPRRVQRVRVTCRDGIVSTECLTATRT